MLTRLKAWRSKMVRDVDLKDLTNTKLRKLLDNIKESDDQFILKDNGQPIAAILSIDDLELLKKAKTDKEKAWQNIFKTIKEVHDLNPNVSAEEVDADVDQAIKEVRQGRS